MFEYPREKQARGLSWFRICPNIPSTTDGVLTLMRVPLESTDESVTSATKLRGLDASLRKGARQFCEEFACKMAVIVAQQSACLQSAFTSSKRKWARLVVCRAPLDPLQLGRTVVQRTRACTKCVIQQEVCTVEALPAMFQRPYSSILAVIALRGTCCKFLKDHFCARRTSRFGSATEPTRRDPSPRTVYPRSSSQSTKKPILRSRLSSALLTDSSDAWRYNEKPLCFSPRPLCSVCQLRDTFSCLERKRGTSDRYFTDPDSRSVALLSPFPQRCA